MQNLALVGGPISFEGAVSTPSVSDGVQPWRLPWGERELFHEVTAELAAMPAGVRLTLLSNATVLEVELTPGGPAYTPTWGFDLLVDGRLHQRLRLPRQAGVLRFTGWPPGEHRLELWLDGHGPIVIRQVRIDDHAQARPWHDLRPRWITYGSSITQCAEVEGPTLAWPALVGERFGLHVTNLGIGGGCHLEPMMGRMIRDLPAQYISLCLGANVYGHSSLGPRTFREAVIGLVRTLRDAHPRTPVALCSPIYYPAAETTANAAGMTLVLMRQMIAQAAQRLRVHGDYHLIYQDGLELFGPEYLPYMPDQLHPNDQGYAILAERFAKLVMPRLLALNPIAGLALPMAD